MLDGRGHDVPPALACAMGGAREQGLVVGLGASRGELDLAGTGMEALGHGASRSLKGLARAVSGGVLARGVGEGVARAYEAHGVECRRARPGGGRVVEVDEAHGSPFRLGQLSP